MRHFHLFTDAVGWVNGTRTAEGPRPPRTDPGIPVNHQIVRVARDVPMLRHWDGELELPQDDRDAWKMWRAHGHTGAGAHARLELVRQARNMIRKDITIAPKTPQPMVWPGMPEGPVAGIPGLTLHAMTHEHLDGAAAVAVDYNIYLPQCPGIDCHCQPPEAHPWLMLAQRIDNENAWQMALSFQGRPLQFEVIPIEGDLATFSLTYHMNRERPHWFWREAEKPVYEALRAAGVKRIQSRTRADRPDWIQSLKDNYGAVETGEWDAKTKRLEYPLDLNVFKGWPARRQVGFDQTTGRVRTWEATDADLPAVRQLIRNTIPVGQRAVALRMLDEWWHLDRASILLGARDGSLRYARATRHRKGTRGALAFLSGVFDEPTQGQMAAHVKAWCRQAGYTTMTTMIPTRNLANSHIQAHLARAGSRIVGTKAFREEFTEVETDV